MGFGRFQVNIPRESMNTEDTVVNTWHFDVQGEFADNLDLPVVALQNFYNNIATYVSEDITTSLMTVKVYDLSQPEPRVPIYDGPVGSMNASSGGDPLPEELSLCLSYRAAYASGQPPARRRGRIYIGALGTDALSVSGTPRRPLTAFITALSDAAGTLLAASDASADWTWVVYSPTDATGRTVVGGWVDNAWDIQRRRGLISTTRDEFGAGHG